MPGEPLHSDGGAGDAPVRQKMRAALDRVLGESPELDAGSEPPPIPDHQLLHQIGRGAYGEIWLARNALGTLRAVKIVYRSRFHDDRPYEREFNGILKYEPVSRTHEGLVQILHVGRNDAGGCFYYVMELADNVVSSESIKRSVDRGGADIALDRCREYLPRTLRSRVSGREPIPVSEAARLTLRLAGALAHLHEYGLVHRDVKPANVIFVDGKPKLADIGLVTDAGDSRSFVGTDGFIPPEGPGSPQADLYALGKLLYELATGCDRMDFPLLPPKLVRQREGEALLELNEVLTRACAPDLRQRYPTAAAFQADLNLLLAGRSLRRARHLERNVARLKKAAVAGTLVMILAAVAVWFSKREEGIAHERERAATERANAEAILRIRAESAERERESQLYTALLEQARATVRSGERGHRFRALDALRRAAAISNTVDLRREVVAALSLPDFRPAQSIPHDPSITCAALDPSFTRIALCGNREVNIRSVPDGTLLASLPASTNLPVHVQRWSRDGRYLAVKRDRDSSGVSAEWEIWDLKQTVRVLIIRDAVLSSVTFDPASDAIAAGMRGWVVKWSLPAGRVVSRYTTSNTVVVLSFASDGARFATVQRTPAGSLVSVHDSSNGLIQASHLVRHTVADVKWRPDGRWLALTDHSGSVSLVDSRSGERHILGRHKAEAAEVIFSSDGAYLLSGGWDQEIICWDVRARRQVFAWEANSFRMQLREDGRVFAIDTPQGVQLHEFERPLAHLELAEDLGGRMRHARFSSDGRWLAASGGERLGVWDLANLGPAALTNGTSDTRLSFAGDELFTDRRGDCSRWKIVPATGAMHPPRLEKLALPVPAGVVSLSLLSTGVVFTGSKGSQLAGFDSGINEGDWAASVDGLNGVSADGRWLGIYRSYSSQLYVHSLPGLEQAARCTANSTIRRFEFSPLGDEVAIASRRTVEFWSTRTWKRTHTLTNFNEVHYSPDARTLWLSVDLRQGGLFDAHSYELLLPLPSGLTPLAISPDGHHAAISVGTKRLQVWNLLEVRRQLRELGMDWSDEVKNEE